MSLVFNRSVSYFLTVHRSTRQCPIRKVGQQVAANHMRDQLKIGHLISGKSSVHMGVAVGQLMPKAVNKYGGRESSVAVHKNILTTEEKAIGVLKLDLKFIEGTGKSQDAKYEWSSNFRDAARNNLILMKIADPQTQEIVPVNTPGELFIQRSNATLDNCGDAAGRAEARHRWIRTRELAQVDDNGFVQIIGDIKETIVRRGENICPREIEQILETHPKIVEAAVIGVQGHQLEDDIWACIRPRVGCHLTPNELRQFCLHKISYVDIPKYWIIKQEFPQTSTGKIDKYEMNRIALNCWS